MRPFPMFLVLCIASTVPPVLPAGQDDPRLDDLFAELQALDKRRDDRADTLQGRIWRIWYEHERPEITEIMGAGLGALADERHREAVDAFTRVVELDPEYAEGWNRRATTYYQMGRFRDSLNDIERVLELEPRHFGAWAGRGLCLRELGRNEAAIESFERALEINPHLDHVYVEILRLRARMDEDVRL